MYVSNRSTSYNLYTIKHCPIIRIVKILETSELSVTKNIGFFINTHVKTRFCE